MERYAVPVLSGIICLTSPGIQDRREMGNQESGKSKHSVNDHQSAGGPGRDLQDVCAGKEDLKAAEKVQKDCQKIEPPRPGMPAGLSSSCKMAIAHGPEEHAKYGGGQVKQGLVFEENDGIHGQKNQTEINPHLFASQVPVTLGEDSERVYDLGYTGCKQSDGQDNAHGVVGQKKQQDPDDQHQK